MREQIPQMSNTNAFDAADEADVVTHLFPEPVDESAFNRHQWTDWYNPTDNDLYAQVHVATPAWGKPPRADPPLPILDKKNWKPIVRDGVVQMDAKTGKPLVQNIWHGWYSQKTGKRTYIFAKKRTTRIPSEWDDAIQKLDNNVIVAGLVPQLINKRHVDIPTMHKSLDDENAKMQELKERLSRTVFEKAALFETHELEKAELEQLRKKLDANPVLKARFEAQLNELPGNAPSAHVAAQAPVPAQKPSPKPKPEG